MIHRIHYLPVVFRQLLLSVGFWVHGCEVNSLSMESIPGLGACGHPDGLVPQDAPLSILVSGVVKLQRPSLECNMLYLVRVWIKTRHGKQV